MCHRCDQAGRTRGGHGADGWSEVRPSSSTNQPTNQRIRSLVPSGLRFLPLFSLLTCAEGGMGWDASFACTRMGTPSNLEPTTDISIIARIIHFFSLVSFFFLLAPIGLADLSSSVLFRRASCSRDFRKKQKHNRVHYSSS